MARLAAALLVTARAASDWPVEVSLDLYHAVSAATKGLAWQDINPAGLMGVLKYIHTEVIAEHELSPPDRHGRKDNLEAISRANFRVQNPAAMPKNLRHLLDFGPFMHFEGGRTFDGSGLAKAANYGEFVGIQMQTDVRFPTKEPYYWFSLTGPCPNLPYEEKKNGSNAECLQYARSLGPTGPVAGGLCPGGGGDASVQPTGSPGCTYSYGQVTSVSLDELVGITKEDCGGRRCKDWWDFRQSCTNPAYRQMFDAEGNLVSAGFCVEYDIHPKCAANCDSERCGTVPEHLREAGLPFWRGRCSPQANQIRAEKLAEAFQVPGVNSSHNLLDEHIREQFKTCVHEVPGTCAPALGQGGMYCTRDWAGVCQPCYVPGTRVLWPPRDTMPTCPYGILRNPDYKDRFPPPECKSDRPSDKCCLYRGTCSLQEADPVLLPLDDDGYALAASRRDTVTMIAFLGRIRGRDDWSASEVARPEALRSFAYWQWDNSPYKELTFESIKAQMFALGLISNATLPPTTATVTATFTTSMAQRTTSQEPTRPAATTASAPTVATTPPVLAVVGGGAQKHHDLGGSTRSPPASPQPATGDRSNWWIWVVLGAVVGLLIGVAVLLYIRRGRRKAEASGSAADAASSNGGAVAAAASV